MAERTGRPQTPQNVPADRTDTPAPGGRTGNAQVPQPPRDTFTAGSARATPARPSLKATDTSTGRSTIQHRARGTPALPPRPVNTLERTDLDMRAQREIAKQDKGLALEEANKADWNKTMASRQDHKAMLIRIVHEAKAQQERSPNQTFLIDLRSPGQLQQQLQYIESQMSSEHDNDNYEACLIEFGRRGIYRPLSP